LRLNLVPSGESLVPYFAVSGGVYGERGDRLARTLTDDPRYLANPPQPRVPGTRRPGRGPVPIPDFRGGNARDALNTETSSETDGLLTLGGGVVLAAGPHVFVRPDARAQVVFSGDTRVLGLFTLNFGYRF